MRSRTMVCGQRRVVFRRVFSNGLAKDRETTPLLFTQFAEWDDPVDNPNKHKTDQPTKPIISHETANYVTFSRWRPGRPIPAQLQAVLAGGRERPSSKSSGWRRRPTAGPKNRNGFTRCCTNSTWSRCARIRPFPAITGGCSRTIGPVQTAWWTTIFVQKRSPGTKCCNSTMTWCCSKTACSGRIEGMPNCGQSCSCRTSRPLRCKAAWRGK